MLSGSGMPPSICIEAVGFSRFTPDRRVVSVYCIYMGPFQLLLKNSIFFCCHFFAMAHFTLSLQAQKVSAHDLALTCLFYQSHGTRIGAPGAQELRYIALQTMSLTREEHLEMVRK